MNQDHSYPSLDPLRINLTGTHLIEASAGTGKTWNIAAIYLRLIVLEQIDIRQILVVTFTKAATAELKNRLRDRLDEALFVLQQHQVQQTLNDTKSLNTHCQDDFLATLLQSALEKYSLPQLILRLKAAINDFDSAAIFTIHGFCQRILQDYAFYCQSPFELTLDNNAHANQHLIAAQDFWRKEVASNPNNAQLAHERKLTPQNILNELQFFLARPTLQFRLPESTVLADLEQQFIHAWQNTITKWPEIEAAFWRQHDKLNGTSFQKKIISNRFEQLQQHTGQTHEAQAIQNLLMNSKNVCYFDPDFLHEKTKKNKTLDKNDVQKIQLLYALFKAAHHLVKAKEEENIRLQLALLNDLRHQHKQRKKEQPERSFDDLLLDVYLALSNHSKHAQTLANNIANTWQIALIDEFQDTDPLQYAIFQHTFGKAANTKKNHALLMLGDPKQAIYSFRGADIFAYLNAAKAVKQRYTLKTNQRSYAKLINSISALFLNHENPFIFEDISYPKVQAAQHNQESRLSPKEPSFVVRYFEDGLNEKKAAESCANEIAALFQESHHLIHKNGEQHPLQAKEIAVLVRNRKQGALIQNALKNRNIQSVLLSRDSIFAQEEALSLFTLMSFILQPFKHELLSYLLSGCLFDYTSDDLAQDKQDELLTKWIDLAKQSLAIWQKQGIYTALQWILDTHQVEQKLIQKKRERTLTNLYQLLETLALAEQESNTPNALTQWLQTKIQAAQNQDGTQEDDLLRLESDENLLKIVTMHASKGLQYPIVFCPFAFQEKKVRPPKWHTLHKDGQTFLLHKSQLNEDDTEQYDKEQRAEELRLWYVALTRAEQKLTLYLTDNDKNFFAYLLRYQTNQENSFKEALSTFFAKQDPNTTDFYFTTDSPKNSITHQNPNQTTQTYTAKTLPERRFTFIKHTSFTALTKQTTHTLENEFSHTNPLIDLSELNEESQTFSGSPNHIKYFPAGAKAGVCLHEILEHHRPDASLKEQKQLIEHTLNKHHFPAEEWCDTILQMVQNTNNTPLTPTLNIAMLPENQKLNEMGFLFHQDDFSLGKIQQWFQEKSRLPEIIIQAARQLTFQDIQGYINGFIDLFTYLPEQKNAIIIDYKSNLLNDYDLTHINAAVAQHHYYLQAFIYAIAVARYLSSRHSPVQQISIRYLFLRGLDGISDQQGIWQWDIAYQDLKPWLQQLTE